MKKSECIEQIAALCEITTNEAKEALDCILNAITRGIKRGPVHIAGFGTFRLRHRSERSGKHPRTGEPITIAATTFPIFVAGKQLKEKINS